MVDPLTEPTMNSHLALPSTLAFLGGLTAGSLLAIGSLLVSEPMILATAAPGEGCFDNRSGEERLVPTSASSSDMSCVI